MPLFNAIRRLRRAAMEGVSWPRILGYSVLEIALVVIGILIALQIDNWNQDRIDAARADDYVESLIADLQRDSATLAAQQQTAELDLELITSQGRRLAAAEATLDTARAIARDEWFPFFDPSSGYVRDTFEAILSAGDVNLFEPNLRDAILGHYSRQETISEIVGYNHEIFLRSVQGLGLPPTGWPTEMPGTGGVPPLESNALSEELWSAVPEMRPVEALASGLNAKFLMRLIVRGQRSTLQASTSELLTLLRSSR